MASSCVEIHWSQGWTVVLIAWGISAPAAILYWYYRQHSLGIKFVDNYPSGTEKSSVVSWIFWIYSSWTSQLSPNGALGRVIDPRYSRFFLDLYVLGWGVLAFCALRLPEHIDFFMPLFLWRYLEYIAVAMYQRIFAEGFPRRIERQPGLFNLGYRALLIDLVNYLNFATLFAAFYRAHASYFNPPLASGADALYFSIVTMVTLGYGDITALGCMRLVAAIEVLFGIFMLAVIVGVLIGRRVLYLREE